MGQRKIIHVDMDMFFAAIEIRSNPALRDKPLIIGGSPDSRGVVCTANYIARKYGIHSAMPCRTAYKKCSHAIFLSPDFSKYVEESKQIGKIFCRYTDVIEFASIDEAYLDVTRNRVEMASATAIAKRIKEDIFTERDLTASAGVAPNKFVAKIASDFNKPDGLTVVPPDEVMKFISPLRVSKLPGVGPVTHRKLQDFGIYLVEDLRKKEVEFLQRNFGKMGSYLFELAWGRDERRIEPIRERKSLGVERTFADDIGEREILKAKLRDICKELWERLSGRGLCGKTLTLKLKSADFKLRTRRVSLVTAPGSFEILLENSILLLERELRLEGGSFRLLGLSISNFIKTKDDRQLKLPFN
ncbi:DNA polymerase IV [Candidatus Riflebacteria bacterium]